MRKLEIPPLNQLTKEQQLEWSCVSEGSGEYQISTPGEPAEGVSVGSDVITNHYSSHKPLCVPKHDCNDTVQVSTR